MEQDFQIDFFCLPNTPRCTRNLYKKIIDNARGDLTGLIIRYKSQAHDISFTKRLCQNHITIVDPDVNKYDQTTIKETEIFERTGTSNKAPMRYMAEDLIFLDIKAIKCSQFKNTLLEITSARMIKNKLTEIFHIVVDTQGLVQADSLEILEFEYTQGTELVPINVALEALVLFIGKSNIVTFAPELTKSVILCCDVGCCLKTNIWLNLMELTKICFPYLKSHELKDLSLCLTETSLSAKAVENIIRLSNIYLVSLHALLMMDKDLIDILSRVCKTEQWSLVYLFKKLSVLQSDMNQSDWQLASCGLDRDVIFSFLNKNRRKMVNLYDANMMSKTINIAQAEKKLDILPSEIGVHKFLEFSDVQNEYRASQEEMSDKVYKALETSNNLLIEAGTGTGKTFAYLIPAIEYSLKNNKQIAISTVTNSLLDQIVYKDLPIVEKAFGKVTKKKISYVPLKGASHYICLRDTEKFIIICLPIPPPTSLIFKRLFSIISKR